MCIFLKELVLFYGASSRGVLWWIGELFTELRFLKAYGENIIEIFVC